MKNKLLITFLGALFLSGPVLAQEEDDLYFFTTDRKDNKVVSKLPAGVESKDYPSSIASFKKLPKDTDNSIKGVEISESNYTPTYNYYENDFSDYQAGFNTNYFTRSSGAVVVRSNWGISNSLNWYYAGQDAWGNAIYYNPTAFASRNVVVVDNWGRNVNRVSGVRVGVGFGNTWNTGFAGNSWVNSGWAGGGSFGNAGFGGVGGYACPPAGGGGWAPVNTPRNTTANSVVVPSSPSRAVRSSRSTSGAYTSRGSSSVRSGRGGGAASRYSTPTRTGWNTSSRTSSYNRSSGTRSSSYSRPSYSRSSSSRSSTFSRSSSSSSSRSSSSSSRSRSSSSRSRR